MNEFLLSNHRYEIELTNQKENAFSVIDQAPMAGQCDCDCSSDCACSGSANIYNTSDIKIHIEFKNRVIEKDLITESKKPVVMDAPSGFGKTFLLKKIIEEMSEQGWKAIYLDMTGIEHEPDRQQKKLVQQFLQSVNPVLAQSKKEIYIQDLTRACTAYDRIFLIIDSIENADPQTLTWLKEDVILQIRNTLRIPLRVVFSGRYVYSNATPGEWNNYTCIHLTPLRVEHIQQVLEDLYPNKTPSYWASWIFWLSGGHPASIESIINEMNDYGWKLRLPIKLEQLQDIFRRRICPHIQRVKEFANKEQREDLDALFIFRKLDYDIAERLRAKGIITSTRTSSEIITQLRQARLIELSDYFFSDSVIHRLISVAVEVLQPEKYVYYHSTALDIFEYKLIKELKDARTPSHPLIATLLSQIFYHGIQLALPEKELVDRIVQRIFLLPNDCPWSNLLIAALDREENADLDVKLHREYKLTRSTLLDKVITEYTKKESLRAVILTDDLNSAESYPDAVFVSYAWEPNSEKTVDELTKAFEARGIHIVLDKKDLHYKGSIDEFEQRMGKGKCVILVVSDAYLRSKHCMYELLKIDENQDMYKRIFPIILDDVQIFKAKDRIKFIKYWEKEIKLLDASMKSVGIGSNMDSVNAELNRFVEIRRKFDHLVHMLSDMNCLTSEIHATSGYKTLIDSVLKTLAEGDGRALS